MLTPEQLAKIEKLRAMNTTRGASEGEEEAAIYLIGRMVFEQGLNSHGTQRSERPREESVSRLEARLRNAEADLVTARGEARQWREKYEALSKGKEPPRNESEQTSWWEDFAKPPGYDNAKSQANSAGRVHVRGGVVWIEGCTVIRHTDRAILVKLGLPRVDEEWFPRSQMALGNELNYTGDEGTLKVTRWVAEQKGLV